MGLFREIFRVLKPKGQFVGADVADRTATQQFFDGPVHELSSTGHPHPFLDSEKYCKLCDQSRLSNTSWRIENVPWQFRSYENAGEFLRLLFDLQCDSDRAVGLASEYLGFTENNAQLLLGWELAYFTASKESV